MTDSKDFTPFDFFRLAREAAEHEVEMKIKLARAGVIEATPSRATANSRDTD